MAAGFDGYLRKPVGRQILLAELARFLPHDVKLVSAIGVAPVQDHHALDENNRLRLRTLLDQRFGPACQQANESGDPQQIRVFAEDLMRLATEEQVPPLQAYAEQLLQAVEIFDLDRVHLLLESFPGLLDSPSGVG